MSSFWRHLVFVLLASLLLFGCAGAKIKQELQLAKLTFDRGDFKKAFRRLLPLAVQGSPEAQYALGYMYYYGYGVSRDTISGLFWIRRAAAAGYPAAIKALAVIKRNRVQRQQQNSISRTENRVPSSKKYHSATNNVKNPETADEYSINPQHAATKTTPDLQTFVHNDQNPSAEKIDIEKHKNLAKYSADSREAVMQPSTESKYTLQVFGSYDLKTIKELQARLQLKDSTFFGLTKNKGRDWYVLTYGKYSAIYQAKLAQDQLPKGLKDLNPWVRRTDALQFITA